MRQFDGSGFVFGKIREDLFLRNDVEPVAHALRASDLKAGKAEKEAVFRRQKQTLLRLLLQPCFHCRHIVVRAGNEQPAFFFPKLNHAAALRSFPRPLSTPSAGLSRHCTPPRRAA